MKAHSELRLLPWSGPDGKPCYLSTDDDSSHLSRLADHTEAAQLDLAFMLLDHASALLGDGDADPAELQVVAKILMGALQDTLRIAESRGHRLCSPSLHTHVDGAHGSTPPATVFG
ncbi:hypothetical protein [Streptomyces litmocidini]|uniref:Uncharacterized protein n=1 Tax=Streptomyces litmocidini TaxID=67318 RepID=A0ABW7U9K5_9ACTN